MLSGLTGLQRRKQIWYVRVRVPSDVKAVICKSEIKVSLRTTRVAEARRLARAWLYKLDGLFADIRRGFVTNYEIQHLSKQFFSEMVQSYDEHRPVKEFTPELPGIDNYVNLYRRLAEVDRQALRSYDYSRIERRVDDFLKHQAISVDKGLPHYQILCREFTKARMVALGIFAERADGNYDNQYDRISERYTGAVAAPASETMAITEALDKHIRGTGGMLSDVIKDFDSAMMAAGEWTEKTRLCNLKALELFIEARGEKDIRNYENADFTEFHSLLEKMPANRNKGKLAGKSIPELLAMKDIKKFMSSGTIDKRLGQVAALFNWAQNKGYIVRNNAKGIGVSAKNLKRLKRKPCTADDVNAVLLQLSCSSKRPERFWIPLIGALSACREDEICQLYTDDIIVVDNIPCFRIAAKHPDQKLKNESSERNVPIHPVLIKVGFLRYVEECRKKKQERLWMALSHGKNGYIGRFNNWFRRFQRPIWKDVAKVFHSFRHGVAQQLKGKVEQCIISDILGHQQVGTTAKDYQKADVKLMLKALKKIDYGIDVEMLKLKSDWCR